MGKIKEVKVVNGKYIVKGDDGNIIDNSFSTEYNFLEGYDENMAKFLVKEDYRGGLYYKKGDRFAMNCLGQVQKL